MSIRKFTPIGLEIRPRLMKDGLYVTDLAKTIGEPYNYTIGLLSGKRKGDRGENAKRIKNKINKYFGEELHVISDQEHVDA